MKHCFIWVGLCGLACAGEAPPTRAGSAGRVSTERGIESQMAESQMAESQMAGRDGTSRTAESTSPPAESSSSAEMPATEMAAGSPPDEAASLPGAAAPEMSPPDNMGAAATPSAATPSAATSPPATSPPAMPEGLVPAAAAPNGEAEAASGGDAADEPAADESAAPELAANDPGSSRGASNGAEGPVTDLPIDSSGTEPPAVADDDVGGNSGSSDENSGNSDGSVDENSADGDIAADEPPTVTVSFTFDDTYGAQVEAAEILDAHGLLGTFYVNSPQLHRASANPSSSGPMSIADVLNMQAQGHDIGGHTLGHLSLTDVPEAERIREILGDRAELARLGIEARSFAYPYGHVEDDDDALGRPVLEIARESGYTSARDTNGFDLDDCAPGPESLPPREPFILRSIRSVNEPPEGEALRSPADDADELLGWVDRVASCGGGWLPLVFHHLDADCAALGESYCFDFGELDRLAAALASGTRCPSDGACYRVGVSTVSAAIGDDALAPAPEVGGLRNASLERALDSGATECIRRTGEGSGVAFSRSDLAASGAASERMEVASADTPAELGVERDYGECAIFAHAGNAYELSLQYRAEPGGDAPALRLMTYRLTSDYVWVRWDSGDAFTALTPGQWVRLAFDTGAVPEGTIAISFGLRLESAGALNVDDFDSQPLGSVDTGEED